MNKKFIASIAIGIISGLTAVGMFYLSGLMLSKSTLQVPLYSLMILVATIKLFGVIRAVTKYFERLMSHDATFRMLKDLRVTHTNLILNNFESLSQQYHLSQFLTRVVSDIERMQNYLLRVIYPPAVALLTSVIVTLFIMFINIQIAITIIVIFTIMTVILPLLTSRYLNNVIEKKESISNQFTKHITDFQFAYDDLAMFDTNEVFKTKLSHLQRQYEMMISKEKMAIVIYDLLLSLLSMIAIYLTIVFGTTSPAMQYASLVMVSITLFEMAVPMTNFPFYHAETKAAQERLKSLGLKKNEFPDVQQQSIEQIELQRLNYSYNQHKVLHDIELNIKKGEKIAIVGPSGSGKSTLLSLIAGVYASDVVVNNESLKEVSLSSHYNRLNYMPQHLSFFQGTVRDNLFTTNDEEAMHLLHEFQLPFQLDSIVDDFGYNLSGGERKRLHIIRMLLRNRSMWLLDEPFNGLDELMKIQCLNVILRQDTVIMISHELQLLKPFDRIIVMNNGTITEIGNYETLMKQNGWFYKAILKEQQTTI